MITVREAGADELRAALRRAASPLSDCQQRTWRLSQADPRVVWAECAALRFTGDLPVAALDAALRELVRRHAILRSVFLVLDGRPVQCARSAPRDGLRLVDLTALPNERRQLLARALAQSERRRPLDARRGPPLRAVLVRLSSADHVLLLTLHHLVFDGWSQAVMFRELAALFTAFRLGLPSPLPPLPRQFAELARREQDPSQGPRREARLREWVARLRGLGPAATLPLDHARPAHSPQRADTLAFVVPDATCAALRRVAEAEGSTLFMLGLAGLALALRPSGAGAQDVTVGVALANRGSLEAQALIGPFVNIMLVRLAVRAEQTLGELLRVTRAAMLDAFAFQDVPFDRVMDELDPGVPKGSYGPTGGEPYFRVCVDFTEAPDGGAPAPAELGLAPFDTGGAVAGCDLYVSFSAGRGTLRGLVLYSAELFERRTVTAFVERLLAILGAFEGQLQRRLAEVRP